MLHNLSSSATPTDTLAGLIQREIDKRAKQLNERLLSSKRDDCGTRDQIIGQIQAYRDSILLIEEQVKRSRVSDDEEAA